MTKRQHFSISLLYLWTSPLQTILMIRAGTLRSREDERVKKGEEGYGEVRAVANCAKGQWGMPSKVGGRKWRQHMGGVAARQRWCKNMVTGSDWKKPLSETFNKMQNFTRVGFHSLLYVNLETPRKAPHQLLAVAEDHTTIWEIHQLRTRQSFFMC